jgi:hypothetical protein
MNYASVEEIIAGAKIRLRLADTSAPDMALEHYVLQGARSINALDSYLMKQRKLDIEDGRASLPHDFHTLVALRLVGFESSLDSDSGNNTNCSRAIYVNVNYLYDQGCECSDDSILPFADTFQIVGNEIVFNGAVGATGAILTYYGRNVDANGFPCFPEAHVRALVAYACYQYALSYRVTSMDPSGYLPDQVEMYRQEWMAQKAWARGNAVKIDARHRKAEIMSTMNALITGKNPYLK